MVWGYGHSDTVPRAARPRTAFCHAEMSISIPLCKQPMPGAFPAVLTSLTQPHDGHSVTVPVDAHMLRAWSRHWTPS